MSICVIFFSYERVSEMLLKWRDEAFFRNMKLNQKVK